MSERNRQRDDDREEDRRRSPHGDDRPRDGGGPRRWSGPRGEGGYRRGAGPGRHSGPRRDDRPWQADRPPGARGRPAEQGSSRQPRRWEGDGGPPPPRPERQDRPQREWQDRPQREWQDRPRREWQDRPRRHGDEGGYSGRPRPPFRGARRYESRPPAPPPSPDLLAEGEELVAGRRPVEEAFAARREARRLLVVPERRAALDALVLHATTLRIPVIELEGGTLTALTGFDGHQGVAVALAARPQIGLDDVLARARERGEAPLVLVLDSLEDPQNLGTLLRSAEACGVHGVIFPTRRSAPLSPAAIKASAGATEHLLLLPVDDLGGTLADLRSRGLRLVGADEGASLLYGEADLRGPLALVVGSEERGISGALRRRLDMTVRIPMRGRIASLNAAVAGSVLLFAAADQRGTAETGEQADRAADRLGKPTSPAAEQPSDEQPSTEQTAGEEPPGQEPRTRRRRNKPVDEGERPVVEAVEPDRDSEDLLPGEPVSGDQE